MNEEITLRLETFNDKEYILADDCIKAIGIHRKTNTKLHKEIERLKDLCNKYEEEHKTTFEEWKKAINIINELEKYINEQREKSDYTRLDTFDEVYDYLQELKGSDTE